MRSLTLLSCLVALASLSGASIYGYFITHSQTSTVSGSVDFTNKVQNLELEIQQLQEENIALRELAHTDGDFIIDKEWLSWIEETNGFTFSKPPQIIRAQEDEFLKSASTSWTENFGEIGMSDRDYIFHAIGLTPQSNLSIQFALGESGPGTRRAMYDYQRGCILIPSDFDEKNLFDKSALTQALSISLIEQSFPLENKLNDDEWLARRIVIHGNSISVRQAYMTQAQKRFQLNGAEVKPPVSAEAVRNAAIDFQSLPLYVRRVIGAHAVWGRHFVDSQTQDTRKKQIEAALSKAKSTLAILKNQEMPKTTIESSDEALLSTSLGAIGILIHAELGETVAEPEALAKDLISDHLEFFNLENKRLLTQWDISFSSIDSAQKFAAHLIDVKEGIKVEVDSGKVTAIISESLLVP